MTQPLLRASNLSKRFGRLWALENVSFDLQPGEVLGVVGRRASGKSTLLNVLGGTYPPQTGEIWLDEQRLRSGGLPARGRQGVELVTQRPVLSDQLDVTQNVFLGRDRSWRAHLGFPDLACQAQRARELLAELDTPPGLA